MRRAALLLLAVTGLTGCAHLLRQKPDPAAAQWPITLQHAARAADSADFVAVEKHLVDFITRFQGSPEAREAIFWRALYRLDPANGSSSLQDGVLVLDQYLADTSSKWYRTEATVLRRIAVSAQNTRTPVTGVAARDTVFRTRDDEVAALRTELARVNAELERIKRRLANPKG